MYTRAENPKNGTSHVREQRERASTVKSGLKPRPTAKFADQLTSTAMLEAGTRNDGLNSSAVINQGIDPGPRPKKVTKRMVMINEILLQNAADLTSNEMTSTKLATSMPARPVKCRTRRPRRSMRKMLTTVTIMFVAPRPRLAYSALSLLKPAD